MVWKTILPILDYGDMIYTRLPPKIFFIHWMTSAALYIICATRWNLYYSWSSNFNIWGMMLHVGWPRSGKMMRCNAQTGFLWKTGSSRIAEDGSARHYKSNRSIIGQALTWDPQGKREDGHETAGGRTWRKTSRGWTWLGASWREGHWTRMDGGYSAVIHAPGGIKRDNYDSLL